jgi:N-acetylglucosamine-6-phosphate deacetylase
VTAALVVSGSEVLPDTEVVVEQGVIVEIRPASGNVADVVLVPGFVDLQVNGVGEVNVATAAGDVWDRIDAALLRQGVTTWCPTITSAPLDELEASVARVAEAGRRVTGGRPAIAGAHLEGPFLSTAGAHPREHLRSQVDRRFLEEVADALAVVTLAPELPGALDAVAALSARGVLVAMGHSTGSAEAALAGADSGARLVTHVGNATGTLHQRAPGLTGAALADERLSVSVIADLVHCHSVFLRLVFAAKGAHGVALVTDAVAHTEGAHTEGAHTEGAHTEGAHIEGAHTRRTSPPRLRDGTLAGSVLTMDGALTNTVARVGVPLADAVASASTVPARLLGLRDRGAIAPGMRADLVALGRSDGGVLDVRTVWVAGVEAWRAAVGSN